MGARILVADDSVTIQKVVELTFSKEDFTLTQARNGQEAIRKAKTEQPDLVLLDLVMPDMNGYDVCVALRAEPSLRSVPIILLAGTFEPFDQQRGARAGANDFVTKPFESQVLIGKVKQLLFAKTLEMGPAPGAISPAPEAVTVKIPPVPPASPAAPEPPGLATVEPQSRPTPLSEDESWQRLGGAAAPAPAGAAPAPREELPVAEIGFGDASTGPETPPLDLSALDLAPLPVASDSTGETMEVLPLPESLSLDDLLAATPETSTFPPPAETAAPEAVAPEPVFELSPVAGPPLPMVEVGGEGTPPLSVDDLLGPAIMDALPADTPTLELPEIDLTALSQPESPGASGVDFYRPEFADRVEEPVGSSLDDATIPPAEPEPPVYEAVAPSDAPGFLRPGEEATGRVSSLADAAASLPLPEVSQTGEGERAGEPAASPSPVGATEEAPPTPATVIPSEMAAMREAVTERVAHDLTRELSEKLLERFEKIVWEVVPDLAEILITKELERIRRLAEEEKSS